MSQILTNPQIKIKSGILPTSYTPTGLLFDDDTEIPADVIVLATGFRNNLRRSVASIIGDETADKLDDFFGLDAEGEIRGFAKPIGREFLPIILDYVVRGAGKGLCW